MNKASIEERKNRHLAFWHRTPTDRPLVQILRPNSTNTEEDRFLDALKTSDLHRYGSDADILIRRAKQTVRRTKYFGDALPLLSPPVGPSMLSAFLGARVEIAPTTVWFHPTFNDLADLEDVTFDPSNPWWRLVEECAVRAAQEPAAAPMPFDLGSLGDNLAALIGGERLILEMLDRPELVKKVLRRMLDIAKLCYERLFVIAERPGLGTANWLGLWSPAKTGILQNDFSIMLPTGMYQEFFTDEFEELSRFFDYRIFHVDGTKSQKHIDDFLIHIPRLNGCQLGSDPGTRAMEILPVIKALQSHGKCVHTYVFPDEIEALFSEIPPEGISVITAVNTDEEAESVIERLTAACSNRSEAAKNPTPCI